jgi:predicted transposase YbfD/YdcC
MARLPKSLESFFEELPDPRVERTRRHKLVDILVITLLATICGCEGWDAIQALGDGGEEQLGSILELPHGIPSADTFRRVMSALDVAAFRRAFIAWVQALARTTRGKLVAIDGKTVRGAFAGETGEGALHLVNAWVTENQLVLGQFATDVKSNEITAIPELLALLDLRGAIVSIDAMGCQKNIARCIVEKDADYIFGLKGNQPTLHQEVLTAFDDATCERLRVTPGAFHESVDKGHGRLEVRRVSVLREADWLTHQEQWPKLRTLILVESERTVRGETSCERRAYVSSLDETAERLGSLVRAHWHIENKLHWVLDVTFGEDRARIGKKNGAENIAAVRKMAVNLLKSAPLRGKIDTVAAKKRQASWSFAYALQVMSAGFPEN